MLVNYNHFISVNAQPAAGPLEDFLLAPLALMSPSTINPDIPAQTHQVPSALENASQINHQVAPQSVLESALQITHQMAPPSALENASKITHQVVPPSALENTSKITHHVVPPLALMKRFTPELVTFCVSHSVTLCTGIGARISQWK